MQLTAHFLLDEFLRSQRATREGIAEQFHPPADVVANLRILANRLELVRAVLGRPILISSGYRCPRLNALTPGADSHSAHMAGLAADFTCAEFGTPLAVCRTVVAISSLEFDRVIYEYESWCHLAVGPGSARVAFSKHYGDPTYHVGLSDPPTV